FVVVLVVVFFRVAPPGRLIALAPAASFGFLLFLFLVLFELDVVFGPIVVIGAAAGPVVDLLGAVFFVVGLALVVVALALPLLVLVVVVVLVVILVGFR